MKLNDFSSGKTGHFIRRIESLSTAIVPVHISSIVLAYTYNSIEALHISDSSLGLLYLFCIPISQVNSRCLSHLLRGDADSRDETVRVDIRASCCKPSGR